MIFLGDLACPDCKVNEFNECIEKIDKFRNEILIINFEAVFLHDGEIAVGERLYNSLHVLDSLSSVASKVVVSIANNHMYDYPEYILHTIKILEEKGIGVVGLAIQNNKATPYIFKDNNGKTIAIFSHCWDLYTNTNPNTINDVRIVDFNYDIFAHQVIDYTTKNPTHNVYCFMHWNYDLEELPFPMHIKFAHHLIDNGVAGVIGSHSHVVQPVEIYQNKPIAYCLGNFYLPSGIFFDGKLTYPKKSTTTIGICTDGINHSILEFQTDTDVPLRFLRECKFNEYDINQICSLSQPKQYRSFFKKKRKKRLLVPVFNSFYGNEYKLKKTLAKYRIHIIKLILKIK